MTPNEPIDLETPDTPFESTVDNRPRMPEPLPVRLVTVDHAHLPSAAGLETRLDDFYVLLLGFERLKPDDVLTYRAENFNLCFDVLEPPLDRDTFRALGVEIPSLAEVERKLIDRQVEYIRQKGIVPGHDNILLQDPAGNWLELTESRLI